MKPAFKPSGLEIGSRRDLRNRAKEDDRPQFKADLRESSINGPKHPCWERGHEHIFARGDRYGCCVRCGNEVLT